MDRIPRYIRIYLYLYFTSVIHRAGVNSKGIGINQFNSKSNSGIGAELELKDFEREELELELKKN